MDLILDDIWKLLGQKELEITGLRKEIEHLKLSAALPRIRPVPVEPPDAPPETETAAHA